MKKIIVIGSGGAGKSTFSQRLGARLGLEVIHLDAHHWRPGWVAPPKDVWHAQVAELVKRDAWVMDGNFSSTLELRVKACDTVVFLDLPRRVCMWRVMKRLVTYYHQRRPDMAEGCRESFDFSFLRWVWGYRKRTRPTVVRLLEENEGRKRVVRLRTAREVEEFLSRGV